MNLLSRFLRNRLSLLALLLAFAPAAMADDNAPATGVTFSKDVAPIFQQHCQTCHRPGDIAPMSLLNYKDARPYAKSIRKAVSQRTMPPWSADAKESMKFVNDTSLSEKDLNTIVNWIDQGTLEGNPTDLPPAKVFADDGGWKLGTPELTFKYPEPFLLGKNVEDEYRCYVMPIGVDHDVWLKGVEYHPGNRAVVHHYIVFLDSTDRSLKMDQATPEPGFECGMGGGGAGAGANRMLSAWAPGNMPKVSGPGAAFKIPKGSYLVLQIHYHNTTGKDQLEQSTIGMHLAKEPIIKEPKISLLSAWQLNIKAGDAAAHHEAKLTAQNDMTVYSVAPHMHFRGKDMRVFYTLPGQEEKTLIWVPRYDFNWQITYELAEPIKAPKGTQFRMVSTHDNSDKNPFNPRIPPVDVHWGEETQAEMAIAFLGSTADAENLNVTPVYPIQMSKEKLPTGSNPAGGGQ